MPRNSSGGIQHDPAVVARKTNVDEVAAKINGIGRRPDGLDVGAVLEGDDRSLVSTIVRCVGHGGAAGTAGVAFKAAVYEFQWPTKLKRGDRATVLLSVIVLEVAIIELHGEITIDRSGRNPPPLSAVLPSKGSQGRCC